ncbi:MAG: ABC transporter substrate-binding protein [Eubacteriales bacterium]|nr:ABC transporter substrate-binding protein [Eubacteriales bacterium]
MRRGKRVLAGICAAVMAFSLAACSSGGSGETSGASGDAAGSSAESGAEIKTVSFALPTAYDTPDGELVQDAINAITEEKYGIHFNISYVATGNWQQQSNLLLTGDEVDVVALFMTPLATYVKNGQVADLTDYYANASEEFRSIWSEDEMKGTSINGKIYGIPNFRNFGNYFGLNIDEEIAAEFGIENGQKLTMEEVDAFLQEAHAKYPDRYGLAPQGGTCLITQWTWDGLGDSNYIGVLSDRGQTTTVENIFNTDDFVEFCTWARKWYNEGMIMQDILSNTEAWQPMIQNKKAIAAFDNYGVNAVAGMIRTVIIEPWSVSNSYSDLSYGINANSKDKDAAWQAMEILYTDQEVSILLNDGIEGTHYVKNEDGTISFVDGKTASDVGYGMADLYWITPYSANSYPLDINGPDFFTDLLEFNENTQKSQAFGFAFDITPVTDQYAACSNIMLKYFKPLLSGAVDVESTIQQANEELAAAGVDEVIAEKQRQLDEFLAQQ